MASTLTAASVIEQLDKSPDVLTWLNTALDVPDDATSSDPPLVAHASTLDVLQTATSIAAQSTSTTLEHVIDDIARAAPRLAYDIHFTRDSALALRNVLAQSLPPSQSRSPSAQATTDFAEPDATSKVLEQLQHLDTLRARMEAARDVLREAESWSALETEVTTLLAEKAYARAASRLSASARMMPVSARMTTTPGAHEPRRALLTSLANQFEAALSPDLVRAVTARDVESCKSFYAIFVDIEREGEFRNYYYGTRRSSIVETWSKAVIEGEPASSEGADKETPQSLSTFYPFFLSSFLAMLNGERTALPNIFPDPERTLATLIYTTLSVLTPPPAQRLAALFHNGSSATALKDVVKLFQASEEFARGAERILEKLRASAPPMMTPSSSSPEGKHPRRRSVRMSMSWRSMSSAGRLGGASIGSTSTIASTDEGAEWDQCLFQPFLDFQVDFGTLERRLLDETLGSPLPGNVRDLDGDRAARAMRERAVDVFSAAEESIERCLVFTHGYGSVGLVQALDTFVSAFVEAWTNSISNLVGIGTESRSVPGSGSKPVASAAPEDEELADLDYTSQDWAHIQRALHLLAAGRAVKDRLGMFEARLLASLRHVSTVFRAAWGSSASGGVYTPGVTKGQGLLLAQSSLNALDLRELLTRVVPSTTKPAPSLFPSARAALTTFARTNQRTLQGVLLSPLYAHLAAYPSLPLWSAARVQEAVPGMGMAGVVVPRFSLSPSEVAHRVGDGLLNLPRLFEVYAEDDALGFELSGLTAVDGMEAVTTMTTTPSGETDERGEVYSPEAVTAAWLSSLGRTTVVHLTRDVLPRIRMLSVAGAAQLNADLGYLETIVRALGVDKGDLERWKALVGMTDEEWRVMLASDDGNDKVVQTVAKMRKWTV